MVAINVLSYANIFDHVKQALADKPVPSVVHQTLEDDVPADTNAILAITEKLLAVNRGEAEPDERDSLEYRRVHTPDKLFAERVKLDAHKIRRVAMRRVSKARSLKPIGVNHFDPYMEGLISGNPLSSPLEETNTLSLVEQARRVTQMGPGGIPSEDSVTEDSQSINPSIFGFLSSVEGPECFSSDTEVFTKRGWVLWPEIRDDDQFACRNSDGQMFFDKPDRLIIQDYVGPMVQADARMFHLSVTPNHRLIVSKHLNRPSNDPARWFELYAGDFDKYPAVRFDTGSLPYEGARNSDWLLPEVVKSSNSQISHPPINIEDWAEFMGWYLSEGNAYVGKRKGTEWIVATTHISQSENANPDCCVAIRSLLERLPFSWSYSKSNRGFVISGKQLTFYLQEFGFALDKFIPEYLFETSISARQKLLKALLLGDGRINKKHTNFTSGSKQLAADFERLAVGLGFTTNFRKYFDNRTHVQAWSYEVSILKLRERVVARRPMQGVGGVFTTTSYSGKVYCATVPGGLLLTRRGASTGIWSGNSSRIGVDTRLATGAAVGDDGRIYNKFLNRKTGKKQWLSSEDTSRAVVGLPD